MERTRIVVFGCGVMGRRAAEALLGKKSLELIGAVDIDERIIGSDLGELLDLGRKVGIPVVHADQAPLREADTVVLTTGSRLRDIEAQINTCIDAGANVVSTCEELAYPWIRNREVAGRIDARARAEAVTVIGTGINPGYLMDTLPLVLTAPCLSVRSVTVTRVMNAATRRLPFQEKVGIGLAPAAFRDAIDRGAITGHVGLRESMQLIAAGLGWSLDCYVEEPPAPVLAKAPTETGLGTVAPGEVIGLSNAAYAREGHTERIRLQFFAYAGIEEEYDEVEIDGERPIRQRIIGGINGDTGTVAVTVHTAARVLDAAPGLKTMIDIPVVTFVQ